jgi:hypothetical protein
MCLQKKVDGNTLNEETKMKKFYTFLVALAFGAMTSTSAFSDEGGLPVGEPNFTLAPAGVTTEVCPVKKISVASSNNIGVSTTSTTFVDVPDMSVSVNIPGKETVCVEVQYTANVFTGADELIYVQATSDGVACFPPDVQFEGDSDEDGDGEWARAHAFNFICTGVKPGLHTFTIQWRSFFGGTVFTHWRTMAVKHK